jgi:hypothetical protein
VRYFLIGLAIAYAAAAIVVCVSMQRVLWWDDSASYQAGVLLAAVLPFAASWLVADVLERLTPRLAFDPRTRRRFVTIVAGVFTGVLGVVLGAAAVMFFEPWVPEAVLLAAGGAMAPVPVVLLMKRRRERDACLGCGYDLSASRGVCPECGAVGSRA